MKREKTIRDRWWYIRRQIEANHRYPVNPLQWSVLIREVIDNKKKLPAKYKFPMIFTIIEGFKKLPLAKVKLGYLSTVYDDASVRRHQGYGRKARIMERAFGELAMIAESKIYKKLQKDGQARPGPQVRVPVQTELPLKVYSASSTPKRA